MIRAKNVLSAFYLSSHVGLRAALHSDSLLEVQVIRSGRSALSGYHAKKYHFFTFSFRMRRGEDVYDVKA